VLCQLGDVVVDGLELDAPVIDAESLALNFTNEVGAAGKIRLLKNIAGLWLLQECRRAWMEEGAEYSYEQLAGMAAAAKPFTATIDPDAVFGPGEMPRRFRTIAARPARSRLKPTVNSRAPSWRAWRCDTRYVMESLETLGKRKIEVIHIVGGGSRNALLNQFVADCTGRPRGGRTKRSHGHRQHPGAGDGRGRAGKPG